MFRLAVEKRALAGAGVVKVFATGLLDFDCVGQVQHDEAVSQTELTAAVKAIEGAGLPLTVHATTAFRSWSALWPLAWAAWSTVTS
jgi:imidazolonepropionase-like amidohydrolase